jgi:hypothetical protein
MVTMNRHRELNLRSNLLFAVGTLTATLGGEGNGKKKTMHKVENWYS